MGESVAPRSAGCSKTYSAPESRAARRMCTVRRISSLDSRSSRTCGSGTFRSPMTLSRSRTGGGPPSLAEGDENSRETENVEHGGNARTAE
eukprot:809754-Pleurochrysis_carterae.AAC.1